MGSPGTRSGRSNGARIDALDAGVDEVERCDDVRPRRLQKRRGAGRRSGGARCLADPLQLAVAAVHVCGQPVLCLGEASELVLAGDGHGSTLAARGALHRRRDPPQRQRDRTDDVQRRPEGEDDGEREREDEEAPDGRIARELAVDHEDARGGEEGRDGRDQRRRRDASSEGDAAVPRATLHRPLPHRTRPARPRWRRARPQASVQTRRGVGLLGRSRVLVGHRSGEVVAGRSVATSR